MGYASTGASPNLADYSFKSHADAIAGIAAENKISRAAIGGHDWGGILVYRVAQWYPNLITHIFSVCTAFVPVNEGKFVSTKDLAAGVLPQFGYQLQFGSEDGQVERAVDGRMSRLAKFLNGLYGGKVGGGKKFMDPRKGVELDLVRSDANDAVGKTPLMSNEVSLYQKFSQTLAERVVLTCVERKSIITSPNSRNSGSMDRVIGTVLGRSTTTKKRTCLLRTGRLSSSRLCTFWLRRTTS